MKPFCLIILALMLAGCGAEEDALEASPPALLQSRSIDLRKTYSETQDCTGLKGEAFEVLSIEFRDEQWPCEWGNCIGEFISPNKIILTDSALFAHELIHYLLWLNSNPHHADAEHENELFYLCADPKLLPSKHTE